jgi:hypothetical protein
LASMLNYKYNLNLKMDDMIETTIERLIIEKRYPEHLEKKYNLTFYLMGISCFVKTDFKQVDQRFKDFGSTFYELFRHFFVKKNVDFEIYFILDSFSELMLNNVSFSQSKLFPEKDIQKVKSKLQVELLFNGKNFILLPDLLTNCSDIQFHFK